ncbi:hypothetical protein GGI25_000014 [Coemansia spiralis]|uniref:CCHC-type domain-containing protein n=2 Tax=Coemansia TaxID=4863 RepID=A0A9W8GDA1_9FUNG|nr:hypothetical protein EDC05_004412 [Coemansia umbellata]KAJ2623110.1 hypothetical protein GGI26_002721 [Coemansia sp. RSA 1358]KAJ2681061.1 hypothetical protein GGI25_000014 [Coemansia spiralis]
MDDEGPAFISFSGLPDEDIHEFVSSVESLRKHFKWSNQVTFCYARTMLKGPARKIVQPTKQNTTAATPTGSEQQKTKTLGDEAIDPNSWANLKAALVFEFSDQYQQDRALIQLLTLKQQLGESSSEYAQRFVGSVSALVTAHPLDSNLLAVLFANGLRNEKIRWELLLRRLNTIDRAVAYVAPDQLYKVAKLTPLLSPLPTQPSSVGNVGELSPTSESSTSFTASAASTRHPDAIDNSNSFAGEADEELLSGGHAFDSGNASGLGTLTRGYTANGATFSLDDDFEGSVSPSDPAFTHTQSSMPYPMETPLDNRMIGSISGNELMSAPATDEGFWSPPSLPDARQRRNHRQSMSVYAHMHSASNTSLSNSRAATSSNQTWTPAAIKHSQSFISSSLGAASAHQYADHHDGVSSHGYAYTEERPQSKASIGTGSEADDGSKSANELNSLADQLENLSTMLRVQSDSRRRRPRLCYRCRQKGHIAADCPLPDDIVVPNQHMREKLGIPSSPLALMPRTASLTRSNTVSSPSSSPSSSPVTWRSPGNSAYNTYNGTRGYANRNSSAAVSSRRYTQTLAWNAKQGNNGTL